MKPLDELLASLYAELPLHQSMPSLLPSAPLSARATATVEEMIAKTERLAAPEIAAGLWLYVDELERSHRISQQLESPTGAFWHGIMHRREGDFDNAHYWFRRAGAHPAMKALPDHDPHAFVDSVAGAKGKDLPELVALQRREWLALLEWCLDNCHPGIRRR